MTTTPNLGLNKPDNSDPIDIRDLNENADILDTAVSGKQDALTFDEVPTQGSTNPVESGGIYTPLAEDRAALVELVDAGGKNRFQTNDGSATRRLLIQCVCPAGTYHIYIGTITSTDTDKTTCKIALLSGGNEVAVLQATRGNGYSADITLSSDCDSAYIYASNTFDNSAGDTITVTNAMICTAADWNMSNTYMPYCPSLPEVYEEVQTKATTTHGESLSSSSDLDNLSNGRYYSASSTSSAAITNAPFTTSGFILEQKDFYQMLSGVVGKIQTAESVVSNAYTRKIRIKTYTSGGVGWRWTAWVTEVSFSVTYQT